MKNNIIPIFFSCDDNYIPFLAVTLQSLEENASKNFKYEIKVLHTSTISEQNQMEILKTYNHDVFEIEFVDISSQLEFISNKLHTRDYYSKSTYYRLFIPKLYPNYKKALYLDCDIVILKDISVLYLKNIKNKLVGAVADEFVSKVDVLHDYVENRVCVRDQSQYFNAGVLLMNLELLRKVNFEDKFLDLITRVTFKVAQDQDYLNAICNGRVAYFSNAWNKMPFPSEMNEKEINLVHYNLNLKPWHDDNVLYESYFWNYAKKTNFYQRILELKTAFDESKRAIAKTQTDELVALAISQANDEKENERVRLVVDDIRDSMTPLSPLDTLGKLIENAFEDMRLAGQNKN